MMILSEAPKCADGDPAGAWMDMLYYSCTEQGKCETMGMKTSLTRSQSQVVQFMNHGGSVLDGPSSPPMSVYSSPNGSSQVQAPVMHPNLVCTLKSILSPSLTEFDSQSSTSGDSMAEVQGSEQRADCSAKASSPESSTSWPWNSSLKQALQQEAVMVPVALIHNRRPYQCAFTGCHRTFRNPQTMRMHHKTHFTDKAHFTDKVHFTGTAHFTDKGLLLTSSAPVRAGHNKKIPSRCPTCYKTFVGLYELRRHFGRKHSEGEKRHACCKCGKRFHIEVDVRDHEKLCGEPIVCTCGMKFAFKCNLVAHKRSHPECQVDHQVEEKKRNIIPIQNTAPIQSVI